MGYMNFPSVNHLSKKSGSNGDQLVAWLNASNDHLVAVVFTAEWSGSGTILRNFMGKIAREMPEIVIEWVDVDESPQLSANLGINHIPSVILLRNHEVVDHIDGMMPRSKLAKRMMPFI
jgi:thioredoxin-like negative regulator of GroEL